MINTDFKFQSDSINTSYVYDIGSQSYSFKFQSDSINTLVIQAADVVLHTLNSNLILLILISVNLVSC